MDQKSRLDELREKMNQRSESLKEKISARRSELSVGHPTRRDVQSPSQEGNKPNSADASCPNTNCGYSFGNTNRTKFCPNCGAKLADSNNSAMQSRSMLTNHEPVPFGRGSDGVSVTSQRNNLVSSDTPNLPPRQGCKALCIGMGAYQIKPLPWPHKDAQDMSQVLHGLGYEVSTIVDQSFAQTMTRLDRFIQTIEPGDDVVYSYSGHGYGRDAVPNLTALDSEGPDSMINVYILMIETAKAQGARSVVIAIDACRHNRYTEQYPWVQEQEPTADISKSARQSISKSATGRRPEDEFGFAILYGASLDTSAFDSPFNQGIQNGMFTYFLKSELTRPGQSLSEIFKRVQKSVMDLSMSMKMFQKPALTNELPGEYYFYPTRQT